MSKTESSHSATTHAPLGGSKRVLDVLRPGWPARDDFLAIDHRDANRLAGSSCSGPADPGSDPVED